MLFGLIRDAETTAEDIEKAMLLLYNRAGNLEKSLESLAKKEPRTILTPEQIRLYNQVIVDAREIFPKSVVLKEDAPLIEDSTMPQAEKFFRILHTAVVPTLHNSLAETDTSEELPRL